MSTCRVCSCSDFVLNRETGEMTCSRCGSTNYIGSPNTYTPSPIEGMENELFKKDSK